MGMSTTLNFGVTLLCLNIWRDVYVCMYVVSLTMEKPYGEVDSLIVLIRYNLEQQGIHCGRNGWPTVVRQLVKLTVINPWLRLKSI